MRSAWRGWLSFVEWAADRRQCLRLCVTHYASSLARAALRAWQRKAEARAFLRAKERHLAGFVQ